MRLIIGLLVVLVLPLLVIQLIGSRMPREHRASRGRRIKATPAHVFEVITDARSFPQWRRSVNAIDLLEDVAGKPRYRETTKHGALTFEVSESIPGIRLVTTIIDEGQPFGGRWTFDLRGEGNETEVTITEDGYVNPPIFRFLSRYVFGQTATIDAYLRDLARRFDPAKP